MPLIKFSYQPPVGGIREVGIAGDFSAWAILEMADLGGIYALSLHIENGKYRYKFIVDGVWMADPANHLREPDPFGGENSLLIVKSAASPRFTWQDVWLDPSLLEDRSGQYITLNRMAEDEYELRFNWFPSLPAEITAVVDGRRIPLVRVGRTSTKDVLHCSFTSAANSVHVLVEIKAEGRSLYLGQAGLTPTAENAAPLSFDLAVLPVFSVPEWVRRGIVYQIFPDRFCNGDHALDPDFSEWYYADSRTPPPAGEFLPAQREYFHLVDDWNDISGLKQSSWLEPGKPDWWSFYGGDLPGVRQKLGYLRDLGVTVIYFNPLWQAKSNHKYDAADFRSVDPHFGSPQDLRELVREAHASGIRVIVDVAFNHTGETFWAFRDCVERGSASLYWNWYDWQKWPLPQPLPPDFKPKEYYQCWWGIKDMPDLNFDLSRTHPSENYVHDIAKAVPNHTLVDHLLECVHWWLVEIGIDGFRLDVPDEVPYWFWQLFRERVKTLRPDAWIVGEIWQSAQAWVGHRYFDSVMNYASFKDPVLEFFILRLSTAEEFRAAIESGLADVPIQALQAMMNMLGSHDTVRVIELAGGDIAKLKLALLFQMTFPGTPHIYYGDEIAMGGGKDPDNRRPFDWDWPHKPVACELREYYAALIKLRSGQPLLQEGEFAFLPAPEGLLAWRRYSASGGLSVVLNHTQQDLAFPSTGMVETLWTLGSVSCQATGLTLGPGGAAVFR